LLERYPDPKAPEAGGRKTTVDHMTPAQRSHAMKCVKLKNGPLEMLIQRELRSLGLSFSRNCKRLPGSPDIVFVKKKVAVFIDGDFWHGWRLPSWEHKLSAFWKLKLRANRKRDQRNFRRLRADGWKVIRLWEHAILSDCDRCIDRILQLLPAKKGGSRGLHPLRRARPCLLR
jgi:DNA mismatch endonuclease, patch repair protein